MKKLIFILLFVFTSINLHSQGLIINEISNGASGIQEYYELVVIGSSTNPLGNVDLGGWIIDDNNGDFEGVMALVGIAPGHIRIKPGFLSSVRPGSIIFIYNRAELSFPNDSTDSNLDCVYILPITSTFLEVTTTLPTTTNSNYSPVIYNATKIWDRISLANSGDAAQVRKPDGTFFHGFSYGDVGAPFPNFPLELGGLSSFNVTTGSGSNRNYYFNCGNFTLQSSFRRGTVSLGEETPGLPNNDLNRYFINALRTGTYDYSNLSNPSNCGSSTSLTPCDFIVPIEITYFRGENSYSGSIIEWQIENIQDVEFFELEKSEDGYLFETIDFSYPIDNIKEYTYIDYITSVDNYYRLKVIEKNSEVSFSKIIYIGFDENNEISIYPNPSSGKFFIKTEKNIESFKIYDTYGHFINQYNVTNNQFDLDLPNGLYFIQIENSFYKIRIFK